MLNINISKIGPFLNLRWSCVILPAVSARADFALNRMPAERVQLPGGKDMCAWDGSSGRLPQRQRRASRVPAVRRVRLGAMGSSSFVIEP